MREPHSGRCAEVEMVVGSGTLPAVLLRKQAACVLRRGVGGFRNTTIGLPAKNSGKTARLARNPIVAPWWSRRLPTRRAISSQRACASCRSIADQCGQKGHRHGQAGIYERHVLVVINRQGVFPLRSRAHPLPHRAAVGCARLASGLYLRRVGYRGRRAELQDSDIDVSGSGAR